MSEFRMVVEDGGFFSDEMNPQDTKVFHVSGKVTRATMLTFNSLDAQPEKRTAMVDELFGLTGVSRVILMPYMVQVYKGVVFTWEEILPSIEEIIKKHLSQE